MGPSLKEGKRMSFKRRRGQVCFGWLLIRSSAGLIVGGGGVGQSGKRGSTRRGYLHLSLRSAAILSHASLLIGLFLLLIGPCIAVVYYQKKNLMFSTPLIVPFIGSPTGTLRQTRGLATLVLPRH